MPDGKAKIVGVVVDCPNCSQSQILRVIMGHGAETVRESVECMFCRRWFIEMLPGSIVEGPLQNPTARQRSN